MKYLSIYHIWKHSLHLVGIDFFLLFVYLFCAGNTSHIMTDTVIYMTENNRGIYDLKLDFARICFTLFMILSGHFYVFICVFVFVGLYACILNINILKYKLNCSHKLCCLIYIGQCQNC